MNGDAGEKKSLRVESPLRPWETPSGDESARVGPIGMALFLAALSMLFGATIIAYLVTRVNNQEAWPPEGFAGLPAVFWGSTVAIIVSSWSMQRAVRRLREDDQSGFRGALTGTLVLGVAFLVMQVAGWSQLVLAGAGMGSSLYAFTFYLLTGLHGAHVLGGVVPMAFMTQWAFAGAYNSRRSRSISLLRVYWHYLGIVWLVMFVLLFLT